MIIGLDVGGTHIDGVIIKNKQIIKTIKKPVNHDYLENSILNVLDVLVKDIKPNDLKQINLSTTIATNAIIEKKVNKVGLILQTGPGLNLSNYDNEYVYFIDGYVDHRGEVVKDYSKSELKKAINYFKDQHLDYIAVASKFAIRNPRVELNIKKELDDEFKHLSLSHTLAGNLNYPRRITTTVLNASVSQIFNNFANKIQSSLLKKNINAPIYILKADGGLLSISDALNSPVETILSGPAASLNGFLALLDINEDSLLIDIGGTTSDLFILANGVSLFEPLGASINKQKTLIRSIFSHSVGLGGDSQIKVINNKLVIGPHRQGQPYALGGPSPTLTDAFIYLDQLEIGSKDKASEAINLIANDLKMPKKDTAIKIIKDLRYLLKKEVELVLKEVNNKPINTIKELLENKQIIPKSLNIIGGPAKLLKPSIEKHFNLKVTYPNNYEIANAIGAALSKQTAFVNVHVNTYKQTLIIPELGQTLKVSANLSLKEASLYAYDALKALTHQSLKESDYEIIEQNSFNMVDGFYTKGKNMRLKAQVKPGLIYKLEGKVNE